MRVNGMPSVFSFTAVCSAVTVDQFVGHGSGPLEPQTG